MMHGRMESRKYMNDYLPGRSCNMMKSESAEVARHRAEEVP